MADQPDRTTDLAFDPHEPRGPGGRWIHIGGIEDLVPAGKVRKGSFVRIRDKSYRVEANRKHFRDVPGMRTLDIVGQEDVGIRHRMIHRSTEHDLMPVLRPPGGKAHPHAAGPPDTTSGAQWAKLSRPPRSNPLATPLAGARAAHAAARGISTAELRRRSRGIPKA